MKHLLLLMAAATVGAAEPMPPAPRDPFAPVPVEGAAAAPRATPAPALAPVASRLPSLDAIGRSGQTTIAVFSLGTRRIVVAVGSEFTVDQEALTFVSCTGEEVLLRNRAGKETRLQIITPTSTAAPRRTEATAAENGPAEP